MADPSLTERTAVGFGWMVSRSLHAKLVLIVGQIALAWFLEPTDFGLVAIAIMVHMMLGQPRTALRDVLVARQARFHLWSGAGFWLSILVGVANAALTCAVAPLVSHVCEAPVTGLLFVLAIAAAVSATAIVPEACLQSSLRFKALAIVDALTLIATISLQTFLAWRGFGAMSWVIPMPIVQAVRSVALWCLAPAGLRLECRVKRCRLVLRAWGTLSSAGFVRAAIYHVDYLVLSLLFTPDIVGVYFFAFNLSAQAAQLLALNLSQVLFPALGRLRAEPQRQTQAFIQANRVLVLVGVPACLLQVAIIAPLVCVFFEAEWRVAIPIAQILSAAMSMRLVLDTSVSLLKAQGRFGTLTNISILHLITLTVLLVVAGLWADPSTGAAAAAIAVAVALVIFGPVHLRGAIAGSGTTTRAFFRPLVVPMLIASIAIVLAGVIANRIPATPDDRLRQLARLAVTGLLATALYVPLLRVVRPSEWGVITRLLRRDR